MFCHLAWDLRGPEPHLREIATCPLLSDSAVGLWAFHEEDPLKQFSFWYCFPPGKSFGVCLCVLFYGFYPSI